MLHAYVLKPTVLLRESLFDHAMCANGPLCMLHLFGVTWKRPRFSIAAP